MAINRPADHHGTHAEWQERLCRCLGLDFATQARAMLTGAPTRDIVLHPNPKLPSYTHVMWYARNGTNVYPIDVARWVVAGVEVRELPFVAARDRRAAFTALADAIETISPHAPEGALLTLWDAAKRVHSSA